MIIVEKKGKEIYIKISNVHLALFEQNKNVQVCVYILFISFQKRSQIATRKKKGVGGGGWGGCDARHGRGEREERWYRERESEEEGGWGTAWRYVVM